MHLNFVPVPYPTIRRPLHWPASANPRSKRRRRRRRRRTTQVINFSNNRCAKIAPASATSAKESSPTFAGHDDDNDYYMTLLALSLSTWSAVVPQLTDPKRGEPRSVSHEPTLNPRTSNFNSVDSPPTHQTPNHTICSSSSRSFNEINKVLGEIPLS